MSVLAAVFFLVSLISLPAAHAQDADNPPFIADDGLIVMQAESVPRPANWKFENTEEGHTGAGYLRYIGENHFSEPGFDIMEYNIIIEHPGLYRLFVFQSHIGAPEPDQHNDHWSRMDDGEWIKTVHGGVHIDLGFSYHTTWTKIIPGEGEQFFTPEYDLEAGPHTFYISGRSNNVRIDRIHLWKLEPPNNVPFSEAIKNTLPESTRDGKVLAALPNQVSFPATQVGDVSAPISVSLTNGGGENININNVTLSGTHPNEFGHNFSGSLTVPGGGSNSINVTFDPTGQGFKTAKLTFEHDGLNSPTSIDLFGTATSGGAGTTVLFRVNAGGPQVLDGAGNWEEDQTADETHANGAASDGTPHPFVNSQPTGDWTFGRDDVVSLDASVPPGTPMEMFQRGRWDPGSAPNQQWDIPIDAGKEIEVRLYFSEQFFTAEDEPADQGWPRIFDASVDGIVYPQFDDINIFDAVGHDVGMMRSVVIISDGNVDIDLTNNSHDPIIQGIEIVEVGSVSKSFSPGWNLVGLPTTPANNNYTSVFDEVTSIGAPFIWNGSGYETDATLEAGKGYWLEVSSGGSQTFDDPGITTVSISVTAGWNLISGPICLVPFSSVSDPSSVLIDGTLFSYSGGYQLSSALLPGTGYWVEASGTGTISMTCQTAGKTSSSRALPETTEFGVIEVSDQAAGYQKLFFGASLERPEDAKHFNMPPMAHDGLFDVRFADNRRLVEEGDQVIRIQSDAFPVNVSFSEMPADANQLFVEEFANNTLLRSYTVAAGDEKQIFDDRVTAIRIANPAMSLDSVPERFVLQGNYPNPFNPTTNVVLDMPEAGTVHLEVYDLLGRRVMSVPGQQISAGAARQIGLDASSLASGTYIYHVRAEMASEVMVRTGRMTLLK